MHQDFKSTVKGFRKGGRKELGRSWAQGKRCVSQKFPISCEQWLCPAGPAEGAQRPA